MLYIPISMIRKYVITSAPRHGNAETCRPRLDLGRHFFADLSFDGFRGLKASIFCSRGVPGRLDALLAKSLIRTMKSAMQ